MDYSQAAGGSGAPASYFQAAGTTDFPAYASTSAGGSGNPGAGLSPNVNYGPSPRAPTHPQHVMGFGGMAQQQSRLQQQHQSGGGAAGLSMSYGAGGGGSMPYASAAGGQMAPLNVTTMNLSQYGAGPLSGPGALAAFQQQTLPMSIGPGTTEHNVSSYGAAGTSHMMPITCTAPMPSGVSPSHSTQAPVPFARDPYSLPVPALQREYDALRREYESAVNKLNQTMGSIKTFWSPELKRERAMRKEESQKYAMVNEQLRACQAETQKSASLIRQLQSDLQCLYDQQRTLDGPSGRHDWEAVRNERDRLSGELQLVRDTVREYELQVETQRQTLAARDDSIRKLLDMLQGKAHLPNLDAERMELERSRARVIELENRCRHLESLLNTKEQEARTAQDECNTANEKLRQSQQQTDWLQKSAASAGTSAGGADASTYAAMTGLLEAKEARIGHLEKQVLYYEDEVRLLRDQAATAPRNFTDTSVSVAEYQEMRLKMEKTELELSHKQTELQSAQTRLMAAEEQLRDLKRHLTVVKESNQAKEQQLNLLQGDIEALRSKLESKNETIEQKQVQINNIQTQCTKAVGDANDMKEQVKIRESKVQMLQRKIDGLEEVVNEKSQQVEQLKQRLLQTPAVQQQRQMQDQIEQLVRDKERLQREFRDQAEMSEQDRQDLLESHRADAKDLRLAIDSLQKEIADRQVLIESQGEKIADMTRELNMLRKSARGDSGDKSDGSELDRLSNELDTAREEVDKLLQMVKNLEKERDTMKTKLKDSQRQLDDFKRGRGVYTSSSKPYADDSLAATYRRAADEEVTRAKEQRIEELEEALRESVSITAERELAIAQHKQVSQQLEARAGAYREQLEMLQSQFRDMNAKSTASASATAADKDSLIRAMRHERQKHVEEVLQLKHEAIVAAISEKDAHIALLEATGKNPDELRSLRRHKDNLMRKLKDENEDRARLSQQAALEGPFGVSAAEGPGSGHMDSMGGVRAGAQLDNDDDAEGIWA